jgi:hypothetical protein
MPAPKKTATAAAKAAEPVKKAAPRRRRKVTHEMIETRAYHISLTDHAGSPDDNWLAAERELLGQT